MTGSQICTAYYRGLYATDTGTGTIAFWMFPSLNYTYNYSYYNTNGFTSTAVWTQFTPATGSGQSLYPNAGGINTLLQTARIVSGGIRAHTSWNLNSGQGFGFAGSAQMSQNMIINGSSSASPSVLTVQPYLRSGSAQFGVESLIRPIDTDSYNMFSTNLLGASGVGTFPLVTTPLMVITSGQSSGSGALPVYFESVLNFEGIIDASSATTAVYQGPYPSDITGDSLARYFPSVDSLWSAIANRLSPAGRFMIDVEGHSHAANSRSSRIQNSYAPESRSTASATDLPEMLSLSRQQRRAREDYFVVPETQAPTALSGSALIQSSSSSPSLSLSTGVINSGIAAVGIAAAGSLLGRVRGRREHLLPSNIPPD
jgi:hypothetical protein